MEKPKSLHEAIQRLDAAEEKATSLQSQFDQQSADLEAATALNEENQNQVNKLGNDLKAVRLKLKPLRLKTLS
jgi:multidrug resistance efflux pump